VPINIKIETYKNYNFVHGFIWVGNFVSDIKRGMQNEGV
jgi:hypothetical protein